MEHDDSTQEFTALSKGAQVNQYHILDRIGAGGMGEVYLAEDSKLKRKVALKFLSPRLCSDPTLTVRFMREAEATAKLNHPNVITIHDVDEYKGRPFFAMELIEGLSLRDLTKKNDLDLKQIVEIAIQICEGLGAAHDKQITHRDIKPGNIVIDAYGRPKILDFGLAAIQGVEHLTKTGSTLGTVGYMSPEQVRGDKVDHRSDLYSLGVVLYELIAGRPPFQKDTEAAMLRAIVDQPIEPLSRYKAGVPQELETLVAKLLEKRPGLRYQSASGVIADLKRAKREHFTDKTEVYSESGEHSGSRRKIGRSKMIFSGVLATILIVSALVLKPWNISIDTSQEAKAAPENSLAALYIENVADPEDTQNLERMMLSLLITDLSATEQVKVVSRQRLFDIVGSLGESPGDAMDPKTMSRVAEIANVKWILSGEILRVDPEFVISAEISDPVTGTILGSHTIQGSSKDDVFSIVDKLSSKILGSFSAQVEYIQADTESDDMSVAAVTTNSMDAYNHYLDALEFQRKFYDNEAYESLQKAVEIDSTFAMAHLALSLMPIGRKDKREAAEKAYQYIDRVTPREKLWILASREINADPPQYEKAIEYLEDLIDKYPEDLDAYIRLSTLARLLEDDERALGYLEKVLDVDPNFKNAHNEIAFVYFGAGELDKAFWAANEYVQLAPNEANPYDTRGYLYARTGKFDKAVADFEQALENKPGFFESRKGMMSACILNRDFDSHNFACQLFLDSESRYCRAGARLTRGWAMEAQGKFVEAIEAYRQGIGADILDDADGSGFYFQKYMRQVKIASWIYDDPSMVTKVLADPRIDSIPNIRLQFNISEKALKRDFEGARKSLNEFIKYRAETENVDSALYMYFRWKIAFTSGDFSNAVLYAEREYSLDSAYSTRARLGITYFLNGQPEKAVEYLTIDSWENFEDYAKRPILYTLSHYYLGRSYEQSGWSNRAAEKYKEFLDLWGNGDKGIKEVENARERLAKLDQSA